MFTQKNILYILRYDFENGEPIKPRYLVVINNDGSTSIVISVITSQDHVPERLMKHGCIEEKESNIHCHVFLKDNKIGEKGFSFPLNSFIYITSSSVFPADTKKLREKYQEKIEIKDCLTSPEFNNLISCIYKSKYLPRGIKKKIEDTLGMIPKT